MKERPILFSAPMVRAILDGRKTQTRRVIKGQDLWGDFIVSHRQIEPGVFRMDGAEPINAAMHGNDRTFIDVRAPYGQPRDQLWVRETIELRTIPGNSFPSPVYAADGAHVMDGENKASNHEFMRRRVHPSIHMPRWASRILLEITDVRVERLQDISYADAQAEGWNPLADDGRNPNPLDPRAWYRHLWESINGPGSWDANPWVWAIGLRVLKNKKKAA